LEQSDSQKISKSLSLPEVSSFTEWDNDSSHDGEIHQGKIVARKILAGRQLGRINLYLSIRVEEASSGGLNQLLQFIGEDFLARKN
jgi:hypothetical protein